VLVSSTAPSSCYWCINFKEFLGLISYQERLGHEDSCLPLRRPTQITCFAFLSQSSLPGGEKRAATGALLNSGQCAESQDFFESSAALPKTNSLLVFALPSTHRCSQETSLPLQFWTSVVSPKVKLKKIQADTHLLSSVRKFCSRLRTPAHLIPEVPHCLWVVLPAKLAEALVSPLPMPTGIAGLSERSTWLPCAQTSVNL